jgi:hypothetical protein
MSKEEPIKKSLVLKLADIQQRISVPKNQFNKFANFHYRSCEDILEAVKPLLGDMILTLEDDIEQKGDRYYVKATAILNDGSDVLGVSAYARESLDRKGMDDSQITGSTSSYARKYALAGLFLLDDNKDADTKEVKEEPKEEVKKTIPITDKVTEKQIKMIQAMYNEKGLETEAMKLLLKSKYNITSHIQLTKRQASEWIDYVQSLESKKEDINPDELDGLMLN